MVDPRISFAEDHTRQILEKQRQQQMAAFVAVSEGEVSRTEERIRQATALATATSLFAGSEALNRRTPPGVNALLAGVKSARLMPPGMQISGSHGEVAGAHGKAFVRYRPEPLAIEILSLGNVRDDGPALLVRIPVDGMSGTNTSGAALYMATSLEQSRVPAPFAHEAEIVALGFAPEPLRAAKLPKP